MPFTEKQKITQWWAWALLLAINGMILYMIFSQLVLGIPLGNKPISDVGVVLVYLPVLMVTVLFIYFRLETKLDSDGVYFRFFPFHFKFRFLPWQEIDKVYIREYKPLAEYGGWGIKGTRKNRAFNMSGRMGLQLELKNGNKILIGTQHPSEINLKLLELHKN